MSEQAKIQSQRKTYLRIGCSGCQVISIKCRAKSHSNSNLRKKKKIVTLNIKLQKVFMNYNCSVASMSPTNLKVTPICNRLEEPAIASYLSVSLTQWHCYAMLQSFDPFALADPDLFLALSLLLSKEHVKQFVIVSIDYRVWILFLSRMVGMQLFPLRCS